MQMGESNALRILVVDDNPAVHEHFRLVLSPPSQAAAELEALEGDLFGAPRASTENQRFVIDSALEGQKAVEMVVMAKAAGQPYALAFVDVRMPPGMDGIETLSWIQRTDPEMQAVICSAYSDHTWQDIVQRLGHRDGLLVLRKPFDPLEAQQIAHALTRKWQHAREVEERLKTLEQTVTERTLSLDAAHAQLAQLVPPCARAGVPPTPSRDAVTEQSAPGDTREALAIMQMRVLQLRASIARDKANKP
jgi:CheY-like chemotaxis protein